MAAGLGQTEMVQCLVNRGAHLKQRNAAGLKAEGVARLAGFEETADNIAMLKLTPVLERTGIFAGLRRNDTLKNNVLSFVKSVDVGISDFNFKDVTSLRKNSGEEKKFKFLQCVHNVGKKSFDLPIFSESNGTQ